PTHQLITSCKLAKRHGAASSPCTCRLSVTPTASWNTVQLLSVPRKEKSRLIYFADSRSLVGNSLYSSPVYPFAQRVRNQDTRSEFIPTLDLVGLKSDLHVVGSP